MQVGLGLRSVSGCLFTRLRPTRSMHDDAEAHPNPTAHDSDIHILSCNQEVNAKMYVAFWYVVALNGVVSRVMDVHISCVASHN